MWAKFLTRVKLIMLRTYLWSVLLGSLALNVMAEGNGRKVAVSVVEASSEDIYDWVFAEGLAQGLRREYLNFERGGKVTFIARDGKVIPLRAGTLVRGPKNGERYGQLLARVDERADTEQVHQNEAALVLARLGIEQAASQLQQAENNLALSQTSFTRTESIWKKKLIPKEKYESVRTELLNARESLRVAQANLKTAGSQEKSAIASLNQAKVGLEKTSIFAPFDGVLRKVNIREGDYIAGPGAGSSDRERESTSAMVVVDTSQYEITLNVPYFLGEKLSENQPVFFGWNSETLAQSAESQFEQGNVAKAYIFSVSPAISLDKRAIEVKVHTTAGADFLKDGLFSTAWILVDKKENALTIPYTSIITRDNQHFVYTLDSENNARLTPVQTGIESLDTVEILSGLTLGQKVIHTGNHKLVNGTPVRVVGERKGE